jgi:site-specific recombinase XerD
MIWKYYKGYYKNWVFLNMSNLTILSENREDLPSLVQLPVYLTANHLEGRNGTNRCRDKSCQISAETDYEAIQCWLREYQTSLATYRSYLKEAERFLLWCVFQLRKPLSSVMREDVEAYSQFLINPQPRGIWCAPKGSSRRRRGEAGWKPFTGLLTESAQSTALSILHSLFDYLVTARYLEFNPFLLIKKRVRNKWDEEHQQLKTMERILELDEWYAILDTLEAMPEAAPHDRQEKERLRLLIYMLYFLGLRIHEVENRPWSSFRQVQGRWWYFIKGKGNKLGKIPVNDDLLQAIQRYRELFNLTPLPQPNEMAPIIPSWRSNESLTARQINRLLKELVVKAAERFKDKPEKANRLKRVSPHWLRHLSASMQDRVGINAKHIQKNHRHSKAETTRKYIHAYDQERHDDMAKLTLRVSNR